MNAHTNTVKAMDMFVISMRVRVCERQIKAYFIITIIARLTV